jgi:hypothetical protein
MEGNYYYDDVLLKYLMFLFIGFRRKKINFTPLLMKNKVIMKLSTRNSSAPNMDCWKHCTSSCSGAVPMQPKEPFVTDGAHISLLV